MKSAAFRTPGGVDVGAVTADEMRTVDRVATEELGLSLIQMMEHAGRGLAREAIALADGGPVVVLAGGGGNGGGGLACARHLANRDVPVTVALDRARAALEGAPRTQCTILERMDVPIRTGVEEVPEPTVVVDALIGYGLTGEPTGQSRTAIRWATDRDVPVVALDVPSGVDATTGERPGEAIRPTRTVTLALPKTGLLEVSGDLVLGDLSIPATVYDRVNIPYSNPFEGGFTVRLHSR